MGDTAKEQREFSKALEGIFLPGAPLSKIGEGLTAHLRSRMDLDWAAIAVIDKGADSVHLLPLASNVSFELDGQDSIKLKDSPVDWVAKNRCAAAEPDLSSKSRFSTGFPLRSQGISSAVYMPLFTGREVYGSLMVGSRRPKAYTDRELGLLKSAVIRLGAPVAVQMTAPSPSRPTDAAVRATEATFAKLLHESQKRAEAYFSTYIDEGRWRAEEIKEQSRGFFADLLRKSQDKADETLFVSDLVRIVGAGDSLSPALARFADLLSTRVRFDRISFATLQGEGVRLQWSSSPDNASPKAGEVYPSKDCGTGWIAEHGTTNIEDDLTEERRFPIDELYLQQGMRSAIRLPIFANDRLLATMNLASRQPRGYGPGEQALLERLCDEISLPLEKLLLLSMGRERREFLEALAHEVRTPLTSIASSSKLLREETGEQADPFQTRLVDNILQSAERMERRISYFFELAKLRNQDYLLETETVDIRPLLQDLILQVAPTAEDEHQTLVAELPESLPSVRVNKRRIEEVITTLLRNAIGFNSEGGNVTLRASEQEGRLVIEVQDSGAAFSPEEQEEMFKPYHPAEADRQRSPELRLGLAVARELVELHGGNLWMESEVDKGSVFALSLPICK
jgi:signal transduction histidine kinase